MLTVSVGRRHTRTKGCEERLLTYPTIPTVLQYIYPITEFDIRLYGLPTRGLESHITL